MNSTVNHCCQLAATLMLSMEYSNLLETCSQLLADTFRNMWDTVLDIKSSKAFFAMVYNFLAVRDVFKQVIRNIQQ